MDEMIDDRQQQAEAAEQIAAAAEVRRQRVELIIVLEKHDEFHLRTRNKIDELVEEFLTVTKDDSTNMLHISIYDRQQQAEAEAAEQEQIAATAAECRRQRVKLISILKQNNDPRTRNKIDESVGSFLTRTKDDIHAMLCDSKDEAPNDSNRDTEAEIETALRFFPEVLSRRGGPYNMYPIQYLAIKAKALSFIPLVARLALEFSLFEEKERGGLLLEDIHLSRDNILQILVRQDVEDTYLNVMIQLRQMGYFNKEDIQKYSLVLRLCECRGISEKKFRFLVEWDPTSLIKTDGRYEQNGSLPLHFATSTIQDFRMVFEYGIRYYPKKKGISLLFQNSYYRTNLVHNDIHIDEWKKNPRCGFGPTPFRKVHVMKVVEDILIRYSDTPINITEALITAAIDKDIHLDCVYFLLRREPDVVMKLMLSSSILTSLKLESNDDNSKKDDSNDGGSSSDNNMHSVNDNDDLMATTNPKKRKRKKREDDEK
ncbi:hypothetical protein FRACYDRAFT_246429 [Fragilariopsis cylindrus CCMP1102]|uniref:Uncharacterized protein n=1 Tax=Fragilariopsis cylindrus CCMP1102 TaxID=635003 RepID=A0A1E7EXZ4_9STRA|nr:hypothetical protein FRACYDRAFT_246429 [Fragilariopsis cylindrus CCMP1102]|eukprot:OEU10675.1 hypothetical protein FRACYDRAFT_246429 [Fragilariopsis cylindrus CCMP1102]